MAKDLCSLCGVLALLLTTMVADGELADLTGSATLMQANQAELFQNYCPTGSNKCDEDPSAVIDISSIGGVLFVMAVGLCVGTDTTMDTILAVLRHSKRAFVVGMLSQFVFMPLYACVLSFILKSELTSSALYSYEACVLGMTIVGSLPGGNTSNLFTWFCGGNVSLSILMSLASNIAAAGMLPLMMYIYYELRFKDGEDSPRVPYFEMFVPLVCTIITVFIGMVIRAKASVEATWWTAKISGLISIIFLFLAVVMSIRKYPHIITHASTSVWIFCLTIQPAGYLAGWVLATIFRCSLRDKLTIAFETGVQSFTLGLVMCGLGFNSEKEACQFDTRCMKLIEGTDTEKYEFSWSADGRITEGEKLGQITLQGFLPGQAGVRTTGGCCRFNELIYLDVFKFSAMCAMLYVVHAFWMVKLLRKIFPMGFARNKERFEPEQGEPLRIRERIVLAGDRLEPAFFPSGFGSAEETPAVSVIDLLKQAVERCGKEWAIGQECPVPPFAKGQSFSKPWDQWKRLTWEGYYAEITKTAQAFAKVGLQKNGTVAIYGFNSPSWNVSALAAMMVGGKACGIYPTDTRDQVIYKVEHSSASIAVVEDNKKLQPFMKPHDSGAPSAACVKAIFMYGEEPQINQIERQGVPLPIHGWQAISEFSGQGDFDAKIDPGSPCCLVYTSGTTGMPKAVMLSHDNVCFTARGLIRVLRNRLGVEYCQERVLSYLPLSHVAGFQNDIILPIVLSACTRGFMTVYVARPYDLKEGSLKDRLTFARPTIFLGVPRVWEKFHEGLKAVGEKTGKLTGLKAQMPIICCIRKSTAARWSKGQGLRSARALQFGGSGRTATFLGVADATILSKIRAALGLDSCKICVTGAAPIQLETLEGFGSYGLQVNELYGMSESSGYATISTNEKHVWGSCGFAAPGGQVRIFRHNPDDPQKKIECPKAKDVQKPTEEEQGEICFRGRHIMMGYLANPEFGEDHVNDTKKKTTEAVDDDGWMHSGDMGCLGENGFVRVTGRYKEMIITAGGENVAPIPIEESIKKLCPAVSNVIMIGDKRKFNTCLVTLKTIGENEDTLDKDALLVDGVKTAAAAKENAAYLAIIQKAIDATNKDSSVCPSNAAKVQKFDILPNDFTVEGEELTPTLKMRRKVIESKFALQIELLYSDGQAPSAGIAYLKRTRGQAPSP